MNADGKIEASRRLSEATLLLPWSRSGMSPDWASIEHRAVDLNAVGDSPSWLDEILRVSPIGQHAQAVLLRSAFDPAVLCSMRDAMEEFDAVLGGPGFVLGATSSNGTVSVAISDFAYFDGRDSLIFASGSKVMAPSVEVSVDCFDPLEIES